MTFGFQHRSLAAIQRRYARSRPIMTEQSLKVHYSCERHASIRRFTRHHLDGSSQGRADRRSLGHVRTRSCEIASMSSTRVRDNRNSTRCQISRQLDPAATRSTCSQTKSASVAASATFWPDNKMLFDVRFSLRMRMVVRLIERAPGQVDRPCLITETFPSHATARTARTKWRDRLISAQRRRKRRTTYRGERLEPSSSARKRLHSRDS